MKLKYSLPPLALLCWGVWAYCICVCVHVFTCVCVCVHVCVYMCVCCSPGWRRGRGQGGASASHHPALHCCCCCSLHWRPRERQENQEYQKGSCLRFLLFSQHTHPLCECVCVYWGGGGVFYDEFVYVNIVYFDVSCFYLGYGMSVLRAYLRKGALRPHHYYYAHLPLFWSIKWLWICLKSYLPHVGSRSLCASYCLQPECWG